MRKGTKTARVVSIAEVERYHHSTHEKHLIFSSDRPIEATEDYRNAETGKLMPTFGTEWETQNWGIKDQTIYANLLRDVVFKDFHYDLWRIEDDGSLRNGSDSWAECITQAMTKAYIRNHYRDFKAMWERAKRFGIDCEKTLECGQHIHISCACFGRDEKTITESVRKFLYIINRHYDLMLPLLHRDERRKCYCGKMARYTTKEACKNADLNRFYDDHNVCVNMGHYPNNVELRLVGGQKDYPCFRNTWECVFWLVDVSKSISWKDCDDVVKVFSGCNSYVFNRLCTYVKAKGQITESQLEAIKPTVEHVSFL